MKISEVPLMRTMLAKHVNSSWSEIFEIIKLSYSAEQKACYVKITFGMQGREVTYHSWRDVKDLDEKYEVFDFVEYK